MLTPDKIMKIHERAILSGLNNESDLINAVRDMGTIEYIADKCNEIDDVVEKSAFALFAIANYHPFVEANKRTSVIVAEVLLGKNLTIDVTGEELDRFIRHLASPDGTVEEAHKWISDNLKER